jgi:hypothetical protein
LDIILNVTDVCNWLDLLWLAHNRQIDTLKKEAIDQLSKLINIENVVPVLVCAHAIGEKKVHSPFDWKRIEREGIEICIFLLEFTHCHVWW